MVVKVFVACCLVLGIEHFDLCAFGAPLPKIRKVPAEVFRGSQWLTNAAPKTPLLAPDLHSSGTNTPASRTNAFELYKKYTLENKDQATCAKDSKLSPGIYRTEPFSCIVRVPERHADDKMAFGGYEVSRMPTNSPELRFRPWSPATPRPK